MMKGYSKYKESGVDWVGKTPLDWKITRLKMVSSINKGKKPKEDFLEFKEGFVPYLSMEYLRGKTDTPLFANTDTESLNIVNDGDILILWDGSNAGEIVPAKYGALSSTMAKIDLHSQDFNREYLNYYLQLAQIQIKGNTIGMGIPHVNGNDLRDLVLLIPSKAEQKNIANFLDHQTSLIDTIISKKEKLIELLKEKRQAVINEAVTKGLDPTAKMKDSGIEWLGVIPEGWDLTKLKFLGTCQNGVSQGAEYFGEGHPFVSYSDVYKNEVLPNSVSGLAKSNLEEQKRFSIEKGDVFFTRTSETIEEIGIASVCFQTIENSVFAGFLIRFRPIKNIITESFSKYYFRSYVPRIFFVREMNLVTRASLSQELLTRLPVCLPSIEEQNIITDYLDKKCDLIDRMSNSIIINIQKLKEYRQSLISEAVTGKIDVREWEPLKSKKSTDIIQNNNL